MNRFLNFLIGLGSFVSVVIISGALSEGHDGLAKVTAMSLCIFVALVVGGVLFLEFSIQRYLFPPTVLTAEHRKTLMQSAESSSGSFFRGARGFGHLFLFFYVVDVLMGWFDPPHSSLAEATSSLSLSVFLIALAQIGQTRSTIVRLLSQQQTSATLQAR